MTTAKHRQCAVPGCEKPRNYAEHCGMHHKRMVNQYLAAKANMSKGARHTNTVLYDPYGLANGVL